MKLTNDKPRIIHFSGGRSSALATLLTYREGDTVIFADTTREVEGTYEFVDAFSANEGIPVIKVTYDGGWDRLLRKRKAVPNYFKRFCTLELKIKTARRWIRANMGITTYEQVIGFRYDEKHRVEDYKGQWKKVSSIFPLYDCGITKANVLDYWLNQSYNLDIPEILGNCDACFMKGSAVIIAIYSQFPHLAEKWIKDEENNKDGHTYLTGLSHRQMLEASKIIKKDYPLDELKPQFNCSCSSF